MLPETLSRTDYWSEHFTQLAIHETGADKQLDFSNERVMVQNFAFLIEALGDVSGRRVLDCGCGSGTLARLLAELGGVVSAFDIVESTIQKHRQSSPHIHWFVANLEEWSATAAREQYDIIVASEVLEYVALEPTLGALYRTLAPGGRLIITMPNAECRIVQRTTQRFDGQYRGWALSQIDSTFARCLPTAEYWWRGIRFLTDQTLFPYSTTEWCDRNTFAESAEINRVEVVIRKPPTTGPSH